MAYIYKIYNNLNQRVYIGKTTRDVELRFKEHYNSIDNSYINNAMKKDGIQNFSYEVIEECSKDKANERERYWISYYHSYVKDPLCNGRGYNLTPGGDGRSLSDQQIYDIQLLWEEGKTIKEISKVLNIPYSTVQKRIHNYPDFDAQESHNRSFKIDVWKPISVYDIHGKLLYNFDSISQAGEVLMIPSKQISAALKNHTVSHNYRFSYLNETLIISNNKKAVLQFDLQGNYITAFAGAREAARVLQQDPSSIIKACNGKQASSKGFIYIYQQDYSEEVLKEKVLRAEKTKKHRKMGYK